MPTGYLDRLKIPAMYLITQIYDQSPIVARWPLPYAAFELKRIIFADTCPCPRIFLFLDSDHALPCHAVLGVSLNHNLLRSELSIMGYLCTIWFPGSLINIGLYASTDSTVIS